MPQTRPVLKRVKMANGYRWTYGGKLIPSKKGEAMSARRRVAAAARSLTGTKPRANPKRKRTTRRRNPWVSAGRSGGSVWVEPRKGSRKQTGSRMWSTAKSRRKKAATKKRTVRKRRTTAAAPARRRKPLSAAHRRKISLALKRRHRATKRVSSPPKKRRKTVARKTARRRVSTRRRTTTRRRPRPGTKAWMSYIGKKGAAARRRGKKRTSTKRRVRRNPSTYKVGRPRKSKQRVLLATRPYGPRRAHRITRRRYTHKRTGRPHFRHRLGIVKRNPGLGDIGALVKKVLPIYGGMIAARVITGVVDKNVIQAYLVGADKVIKPENAAYAKMAAPGLTFLLSVLFGPSVLKGPTGGQLLEGLQLGSLVTTFDTILSAILPVNAKAYIGLTGYDDMGVLGYGGYRRGYGAYMADPTGYSLPPAHATLEPGMGLDVHEAMALDTYVPDNGMGLSVEEALADSESDYMQRGGAGGSLSKTVFTY